MLNKLLQRQLQKHIGEGKIPPDYDSLWKAISESYDYYEKDRKMLERSIDLSSLEMIELNGKLQNEATELEKTSTELNNLFNTIDEVVYSIDMVNRVILHMSPACERVYGYKQEDFYADPKLWRRIAHPDDNEKITENYPRLLQGEQVIDQCRIIHKNDGVRWLEYNMVPTLDDKGIMVRIDGITRDITDKKLIEETLEKTNLELNTLFNSIHEVLFSVEADATNTNYKTIQMSPACEKVYGYTVADFFANPNLWRELIHPDDISFIQQNQSALDSGQMVSSQYRIKHKDQSWRWIETTVTPTLGKNGMPVRLDGVTTDIHDRKMAKELLLKSEANLRAIFENTDTGYILLDTSQRILSFNQQILHFAQQALTRPLKEGDSLADCFPEKRRPAIEEMIKKTLQGEKVHYEEKYEQAYCMPSWYFKRMTAAKDHDGRIIGLTMAITDISELKNNEEKVKAINESLELKVGERTAELESSNKELEAFGFSVSHDLRSPLRIISGFGTMLLSTCSDKLDEEEMSCIAVMMETAGRMGELIDDLLEFSRLGRVALTQKRVDMNALVEDAIRELQITQGETGVKIIRNDLGFSESDPKLIKQVWVNLISNALKYSSKKDKPIIHIGTRQDAEELIYYVKDNGAGFDMSHANKLFNVFQRLHKMSEYEGTGVGLALAHRIITKHGGRIWADAKVDEGATFYFTLPVSITKN
jgi:PAS domain S-box-containing protein